MVRKYAEKKGIEILQNPAETEKMWHKCATLVNFAETCKRKSQVPAQPVRRTETP